MGAGGAKTGRPHGEPGPWHWWEKLPEDLYRAADGTELDAEHPLKVRGTAAADRLLRNALGGAITVSMAPFFLRRRGMRGDFEQLNFYRRFADAGDVDASFVRPPPTPVHERSPRSGHYRPQGIPAVDLWFDSPFRTLNPALRARYQRHRRNAVAHAQHWKHPRGPRKTLIFVHGVFESWYGVNSVGFSLKWFYKQGYDIVLFTLPFHGYRTERRHGLGGVGYFSQGFSHINECMLQGVSDLRVLLDHLLAQGAPSVGITGLSLGGYHAAMLATVDPRLSFCIPNSPLVTPIDMALDWETTGTALRAIINYYGISITELRHGAAVHCPLSYAPRLSGDRVLVIGGAGDRITAPRFVRLLHDHWPRSHLHWFPGNHVIHLRQADYLRQMKAFMDSHTG